MRLKLSKIRLTIIGYLSFYFYIATDKKKKSHKYRHMPKPLSCLIYLAIPMMVAIIILSLSLFHQNGSYLPLHSSPLSNYANFLRTKYKSISNPKWSPLSSEFYIPLAAVEVEDTFFKDAKVFLNIIQHYSPEEILQSKTPIILDDFLKPTQHSDGLKFVLVEGAPGIGKSTLAKEICQRWSTNPTADNHLKQFSLVIFVQLRNQRAQHATTLYDLLPVDPNSNMKEIERQLKLKNGRNVLWVLDGFDELPYYDQIQGSLYRRLIEGDLLNDSTVLVTSQLTISGPLVRLFERNKNRAKRIVILGFTPSNIEKYAELYFKDKSDELQSFINYYNSTPIIKRLMYIPINAAIVCLVYNESYTRQLQFPMTMTELYDSFTQALILRHLIDKKQVREDFRMPSRLMCKEDLNHLPETTQKEFWKLTKVAYDGVREQQYIFNNIKMTDIKDNLGLMNDISSFSVSSGTQYIISFLSTTLQEYLAALYIANKPKELAKEMFYSIMLPLRKSWFDFPNEFTKTAVNVLIDMDNSYTQYIISLTQYSKNLEVVLIFYAGITGKLQIESDDHTFTVLSESEVYSTLFARCIYESPQLSTKYQNQHLSSPSTLYMEPFDYYFVGYLISHHKISLDVEVRSEDNYEFLSEGIRSSPKEPHGWLILKNIEPSHFKSMQLFQQSKVAIKGLTFIKMSIYSYIINITKSFPHLQLLYYHFPISCNMICVHLLTLDHLKELTINLKGTYEELSSLMPLIKPGRPIKHLKLILSYDDCPPLDMLFYPSSLERLELQCKPNHAVRVKSTYCKINFKEHLYISQNKNLKELVVGYECPMTIFSLVSTIQLRSIKLEKSFYMDITFKAEARSMFPEHYFQLCSKICTHLRSFKYLEKLVMSLSGTHEEVSSIVPLIQPGRPLRHLQLYLSLDRNSDCPPSYMLFYPSSLEKLELFCRFPQSMYFENCIVNFNTSLVSQNTNLKELEISVNCPYWDTILLSLATYTSKLRSLMTYHYNNPLLIRHAANTKLHHHLISLHYLEELSITINGIEKEISSILQLIQPGRPLRHLRLTLAIVSYSEYPPIHMLLYPSSLEKLELLCYHVNIIHDNSLNCKLNFNEERITNNANLKELVITTSCPCIDTFSLLLIKTKISTRQYFKRYNM